MITEKEKKEQTRQMIEKLYQAVVGIPENPKENGLIGKVDEVSCKLDIVNGRTRDNEIRSKVNRWAITTIFTGGGALGGIGKWIGWW